MDMFDRPIPGQSLTTPPRNAPYERPPEVVDPEQAMQIHLDRLTDPDRMEDAMFFLEMGVDLVTLVEGILRSAVMEGVHTVDVSLIIAPVVHEYIKSTADILGVEYNEGFEDKNAKAQKTYARNTIMAQKKLKDLGLEAETVAGGMGKTSPTEEMPEEMDTPQEQPVGLMARRA
jgi:hypothetical protein